MAAYLRQALAMLVNINVARKERIRYPNRNIQSHIPFQCIQTSSARDQWCLPPLIMDGFQVLMWSFCKFLMKSLEIVKRNHCTVRMHFIPVSFLPENTKRIIRGEDGDVNVGGENNMLTLSPLWLAPGHTGVTKSYRLMADGRAGLASE